MPGMLDSYYYGRMRGNMPLNDPMHAIIAPLEHKEFAHEGARYGRPLMAPALAAGIPMWTWLKYLSEKPALKPLAEHTGFRDASTSPASLDEILAGYEGLFSGLQDRWTDNQKRSKLER